LKMLKKIYRLSGEDLKKFFTQKYKRIGNDVFLIFYQKNNFFYPRFALLPKKQIFKKSVKRNKIRRQIYHIIREILKEKQIKNYDFFIMIQKEEKFSQLKESLRKILSNV
jgi:ribonuclease P protein component